MSRRSCRSLIWLRVEHDESDGRPVPRASRPALWVRATRPLVELVALREYGLLLAEVPLVRCDVANRAVTMLAVVPSDEASDPRSSRLEAREGHPRVRRRVLERPKQRFGVWVVVGDVRTAEGRHDAEPLEWGDHRVAAHR